MPAVTRNIWVIVVLAAASALAIGEALAVQDGATDPPAPSYVVQDGRGDVRTDVPALGIAAGAADLLRVSIVRDDALHLTFLAAEPIPNAPDPVRVTHTYRFAFSTARWPEAEVLVEASDTGIATSRLVLRDAAGTLTLDGLPADWEGAALTVLLPSEPLEGAWSGIVAETSATACATRVPCLTGMGLGITDRAPDAGHAPDYPNT